MNDDREKMEAAIKSAVLPVLRDAGFQGSYPHLRRRRSGFIDLLTFQFDRDGGGFVIESAQCKDEASVMTPHGQSVSCKKITAWDLHPDVRRRIQSKNGGGTDSWFRYDQDSNSSRFDKIAAELISILSREVPGGITSTEQKTARE